MLISWQVLKAISLFVVYFITAFGYMSLSDTQAIRRNQLREYNILDALFA